jgi:fructosamine-3-kinase
MPEEHQMILPLALARSLGEHFGSEVAHARVVGGGCIHQCRRVKLAGGASCFLKFQPIDAPNLLETEATGLQSLSKFIRVPGVAAGGEAAGYRWLALEWLDLLPHNRSSLVALGRALGAMHSISLPIHGAAVSGYLGATPIDNRPMDNWREFFITRRIRPFLSALGKRGERLPESETIEAAEKLLLDHTPRPSPLHGDLWTGNTAALPDGTPVVFDPSFHAGDAECDLAMLELFGGPLPRAFFDAYAEHHELPPGRELRRPLYDLLHALNHLLLFGSGYRDMVRSCLGKLGVR